MERTAGDASDEPARDVVYADLRLALRIQCELYAHRAYERIRRCRDGEARGQRPGLIDEIRALWSIPKDRFVIVPNSASIPDRDRPEDNRFRLRERFPGKTLFLLKMNKLEIW